MVRAYRVTDPSSDREARKPASWAQVSEIEIDDSNEKDVWYGQS